MRSVLLSLLMTSFFALNAQVLIPTNSNWKFLDDGSDQGTAWSANGFNDASWASGNAELGYGNGSENTLIDYGPDINDKYITTYARHEFNVADAGAISSINIDLLVDDGAVVYLNGTELFRRNMPTGTVDYLTWANTIVSGGDESTYFAYDGLPSAALVTGTNVLSVEIHNRDGTSSDLGFNLQLEAIGGGGGGGSEIIAAGETWSFKDDGSDQGTAWSQNGFNDGSWGSGAAQLGYGDGDENTPIGTGGTHATYYFRHEFNVTNPGAISSLDIDILVDDGAVVYLNGNELFRRNMAGGSVDYQTLANVTVGGTDEDAFFSYPSLSSASLVTGTNVLAVEVHQASLGSSDISFDLEMNAGGIPGQPVVTRGPYLQQATTTSILVKWRTDISSDAEVKYGTSPGNLNQSVVVGSSLSEHAITLSGLTPNTTYYYALANGAGNYEGGTTDYRFTTSPNTGVNQATRAWILGDCGTKDQNQRNVRDAYYNYVNGGGLHTDMILLLGDNAYNSGTDTEYQDAIFNVYDDMLRNTALWSTRGNHDSYANNNYYDIFNMPTTGQAGGEPSGTESYFSFDYGNIHFISLNSENENLSQGATMYNWCETDLMNTNADWIVVFFHHPPYTKGSHDSDNDGDSGGKMRDMRQNFNPLLETHGVDLILSGHSHSYERTYLLRGHDEYSQDFDLATHAIDAGSGNPAVDSAYSKTLTGPTAGHGAVYITAGSSGKVTGTLTQHPAMYEFLYERGSVVMETSSNEMRVRFLHESGSWNDEFILQKAGMSNQSPVATDDNDATFQDVAVDVDVLANDTDDGALDPASVVIETGPTKGTITGINPTTGVISYLPNPGESGNDVFTYIVCDDGNPAPVLCDTATVTINIQINTAPVANNDSDNTNESVPVIIDVLTNDTDAEGNLDPSSVVITQNGGSGNAVASPTGTVTYTPNPATSGPDVFKYTVDDDLGLTSNEATVTVNVLGNVAPVAADDSDNTTEGTLVLVSVLANDSDPNEDLDPNSISTSGLLQPSHGSTNIIQGVGIEYTPSGGYAGYDQFEYQICDMSSPTPLCDVGLVTVFVNCDGNSGVTADVITGSVYEDLDVDQVNINEAGVAGVTVDLYLDENSDGQVDGGDTYEGSDVTAGDGTFSFSVSPVYNTAGPTLNLDVEIDTDDAWEKNSGDMENDKSEHEMGKLEFWNGLRFQNAGIPSGAVITAARVDYISDRNEDNTPAIVNFYGELSTNAATFNEIKYDLSQNRSKTTASVNWNMGEWFQNQTHSSPDLTSVVQEVIDQPGWSVTSPIVIITEGLGSQKRKWKAWEDQDDPVNAPHLVIDYLIPGGSSFEYVMEVDLGTLPPGGALTTDNVETAVFTATGQEDCLNDFGLVACTPGNSCDDGDDCTINDVYDAQCGCAGTFEDTDGDGVCDADDQCPGQDDALIGTVCDDGDACTTGETYDNNCNCSGGVFQDADGDGVCDADDQCPGQDDALIGTACDDGDACTTGEIYDGNCNCSGGVFQDADGDGVCDADDQCPGQDDALIGTACDDGDACTTGETYDNNCNCSGGVFQDADGDGVCDADDQCPGQDDALIGTACDDGDACTTGEIYDGNCNCSGGVFQDADGDGVCDADDQCPGLDDALIGTSCDDGDDCTINDIYDGNCNCAGTFEDTDGDGVCDADDQCPGQDDALIGTACDDGDACTTGETYDNNCNCSGGVFQDSDGDGVCDADDQCPGLNDALIGTSCDDGDDCTINDIYDGNCNCAGTFEDTDGDGVCDADDQCPGQDDALIGTACDDGDACTTGETYDNNCNCSGGVFQDSDGDGVCDANDQCPGLDDALIGTSCDDGDDCTINDIYDGNCNCAGTFQDTDGDGVCDADDQCPGQDDALIGTACDDGDACTTGETYDNNCNCSGGVFQDSDGDGVCDADDQCPGQDDALIGTACDDGDACTTGETYDGNCNCSGGVFQDSDGDGVCDADDQCPGQDDALIGTSCDDGDDCTINDTYDGNCNCVGTFEDSDGDSVCDADDICPGGDDLVDVNMNMIPDACELVDTTEVIFQISADDDDAQEKFNGDGQVAIDDNELKLGKDKDVGLRFVNVTVPADATIASAHIEFTCAKSKNSTPSSVIIYGEANLTPDAYEEVDFDITGRPASTNNVNWNIGAWQQNVVYNSPDISAIVEELVGGGWTSGDPLAFTLFTTGSQERKFKSHDKSPSESARLVINYLDSPAARTIPNAPPLFNNIVLYPNPTKDILNMKFESMENGNTNFQIFDISGQMRWNTTSGTFKGINTIRVDVSELPSGIYLMNMESNGKQQTAKFMIE